MAPPKKRRITPVDAAEALQSEQDRPWDDPSLRPKPAPTPSPTPSPSPSPTPKTTSEEAFDEAEKRKKVNEGVSGVFGPVSELWNRWRTPGGLRPRKKREQQP